MDRPYRIFLPPRNSTTPTYLIPMHLMPIHYKVRRAFATRNSGITGICHEIIAGVMKDFDAK